MSEDRLNIEEAGGIVTVLLSRPEKRNALDLAMFEALSAASRRIAAMPQARAVLLAGSGPAFCAGIDLGLLSNPEPLRDLGARTHGICNLFQHAVWGWRELEIPVIAAVHGVAFGGGLQLALGADIRIVSPEARLSIREARWGLVPDMGGTVLLRSLVGDDRARELTFTAREFAGTEAAALGLATDLSDEPLGSARDIATRIAAMDPAAIAGAKRLFNQAAHAGAADQLLAEAREQQRLIDIRLAH